MKPWLAIVILILLFTNCRQKKLEREITVLQHKVDSLTQVTILFEKEANIARAEADSAAMVALRQRERAQQQAEYAMAMAEKARKEVEEAAAQN